MFRKLVLVAAFLLSVGALSAGGRKDNLITTPKNGDTVLTNALVSGATSFGAGHDVMAVFYYGIYPIKWGSTQTAADGTYGVLIKDIPVGTGYTVTTKVWSNGGNTVDLFSVGNITVEKAKGGGCE